jgi:hypothetical protein
MFAVCYRGLQRVSWKPVVPNEIHTLTESLQILKEKHSSCARKDIEVWLVYKGSRL